jgi:hypothetical protein
MGGMVMIACVIMHNMIVGEECDDNIYDQVWDFQGELIAPNPRLTSFQEFLHAHHEIRDRATHIDLHKNLMNHIWIQAGDNPVANPEDNRCDLIYWL